MKIQADCHLHSSFSADSKESMEAMVLRGIELGLGYMTFTEHMDLDMPTSTDMPENVYLVDVDAYRTEWLRCKERYGDRIRLLFGVELGLQSHIVKENERFVKQHPFDFVIGSVHICDHADPYFPAFHENRKEEETLHLYFQTILANIKLNPDYDVLGHLDYILRYLPSMDRNYSYEKYQDYYEEILRYLVEHGKGIEVNTGGAKKGLKEFHPCDQAIRRYRELGGEIITIGSDSHETVHIADAFDRAAEVLAVCGFRYYTVFEQRTPKFYPL